METKIRDLNGATGKTLSLCHLPKESINIFYNLEMCSSFIHLSEMQLYMYNI